MSEYINIADYLSDNYPFQIFVGGRGTGKTFSGECAGLNVDPNTGEDVAIHEERFIWMRRTAQELDLLMDTAKGEGANPFKPINKLYNRNVGIRQIVKNLGGIYERESLDDGLYNYSGEPIGYAVALSTIAGIRGIDLSDCDLWIYDEFIPESHVKRMKNEGDALLNAYETINRNREFDNKKAVKLVMLANSNDIYNPIFQKLHIVDDCEKMLRSGKEHRYYPDRGLAIHILSSTQEFIEKKKNTALYRLTKGTDFSEMALSNKFAYNDFSLVAYRDLKGFRPIACLDDGYIYKNNGGEWYVCYAPARCPHYKSSVKQDEISFRRDIGILLEPYFIKGKISFESYELKEKILTMIL